MKRVLLPLGVALGLLAIAAAGWWLKQPDDALVVACPDPVAGCSFHHAGARAQFRFSRTPVPMEAFELSVESPGLRRAHAEFQMIGMDMGFNRYDLRPVAGGSFTAKLTLPVCVSGRRDWVLTLDVDGSHYALPFGTR